MTRIVYYLLALSFFGFYSCKDQPKEEISRPNIVIILADDFGVGDIQAHYPDNKIPTPSAGNMI